MVKAVKYDKMVARNRAVSKEKVERAKGAIKMLLENDEAVTVAVLVNRTGLSREFFYKNADVRSCLSLAMEQQKGMVFGRPQKAILDKAMASQLEAMKKQLARERAEKEELVKKNEKLEKALKKKDLSSLRKL